MRNKAAINGYLLDSNIIIAFLADDKAVKDLINEVKIENKEIFFSMVSVCEIYSGSNNEEIVILDRLFTSKRCLEVTLGISREAGLLRRRILSENRNIKTPDAIIAATAKIHNLFLVTRDNDFKSLEECNVILI